MQVCILSMRFRIFCYNSFMNFAERLKELRIENKLTQKRLAELAGINQSMIARWENGENEPLASYIPKLAEALNCSCDYLLGKSDI